jgi:hypothetical protein
VNLKQIRISSFKSLIVASLTQKIRKKFWKALVQAPIKLLKSLKTDLKEKRKEDMELERERERERFRVIFSNF